MPMSFGSSGVKIGDVWEVPGSCSVVRKHTNQQKMTIENAFVGGEF